MTTRIHVSYPDGEEKVVSWDDFLDMIRQDATPQRDDGGCKVIEEVVVLSFDDDRRLTIVSCGTSYTILDPV